MERKVKSESSQNQSSRVRKRRNEVRMNSRRKNKRSGVWRMVTKRRWYSFDETLIPPRGWAPVEESVISVKAGSERSEFASRG